MLDGRLHRIAHTTASIWVPNHRHVGLMKQLQDSNTDMGLQFGTISGNFDVSVCVPWVPQASGAIKGQTGRRHPLDRKATAEVAFLFFRDLRGLFITLETEVGGA